MYCIHNQMVCLLLVMCFLELLLIILILLARELIRSKCQPSPPIHIFLSFRGTDTRETFASLLYDALIREGFNVFMDDQNVPSGEEFNQLIHDAIERSLGAAIILSKDFASSGWCLNELVLILGRKRMLRSNYLLVPIYVDGVQPYEVRKQRGSYAKAFAKHKRWYNRFWDSNKHKVWRDALTEVAGYRGRILKGKWSKFINELVEEIRQEFCSRGITVSPRCCAYHGIRMDRMHVVHESLKMLAIIGNLIFLLDKFLISSLIKQLCIQFMQLMATIYDKSMVVEKGLRVSGVSAVLIAVLGIIFFAIQNEIIVKKRFKAPVITELETTALTNTSEASRERVTVITVEAIVKKLFIATMNKALSTNLYRISTMSLALQNLTRMNQLTEL